MTTETTETTRAVVLKAKGIFCALYNYPSVPFRSIGRPCWAYAVRRARVELATEAAHVARVAAMSPEARTDRAAHIRGRLALVPMLSDDWAAVSAARHALETELARLSA